MICFQSRQNGSSPVSNDQSSKRRKHKKKEKKSKHSKKSADEVAEEIVHNSVIPDPTDDVNFWLGNDTNGVQQVIPNLLRLIKSRVLSRK